jgi:UDP-N-acetylglucosamine--dolichyl-phosphate N-acetylglucosaminephosphotransferase
MPIRRRPAIPDQTVASSAPPPPNPEPPTEEFSLAPPKLGLIFSILALFFIPFFYLLFVYYPIESGLRRSISIGVAMSLGGFAITVRLIPVAARYLLRRNLYGYDINKRGTPEGAVKV